MGVGDRVIILSAFIDTEWTKGRHGTIVRTRKGVRGPVFAVSIDGTPWTLDFDEDELMELEEVEAVEAEICGLCGMRYAAPGATACYGCAG